MLKQVVRKLSLLITLGCLTLSYPTQARIKCWLNNDSVRECGDTIPPEYSQQGYQEIGKWGVVREEAPPARGEEEIAEERRLATIEEKKRKEREAQKRRDHILLQTFSSVADIERARDERITAVETVIKLAQARNKKIQNYLNERIKIIEEQEKNGKSPREELLKDVKSLKRQLENNEQFIKKKYSEEEEIRASHDKDIEHFKKLRGLK